MTIPTEAPARGVRGKAVDPNIVAANMLMECADYIAATLPKDIDPRAWATLLIYAPKEGAK